MSDAPKTPPRFVPTLTEVVAAPLESRSGQLHAVIAAVVQEQLRLLEPRLIEELERAVRQSIANALLEERDALR